MPNIVKFRPIPSTNFFQSGLFDDFFNRSIADFIGSDGLMNQPPVNISESDHAYWIEFAAPGFEKQAFTIQVENQTLTVSAQRETKQKDENERYTRREFRFESFKRSFKLPDTVNQTEVSAVYENGVLKVMLPKTEKAQSIEKTIPIA